MVGRVAIVTVGVLVLLSSVAGAGIATPTVETGRAEHVPSPTAAPTGGIANPKTAGIAVAQGTDSTVTRILVARNGTATWRVQIRTRLTSDTAVAEYEAFQQRFRENTSAFLDPFSERMRGVVAEAADATGRPMAARNFRAETIIQSVPRRWGVVTYEFRWTEFAAGDDEAVVVGDVFRGQFFLTANDTLEIVGPDEYAVTAADPPPAERDPGTVRWFGRRGFPDDSPSVRFEPVTPTPTTDPTTRTTAGSTGSSGTDRQPGTDGESGTAGAGGTPPDGQTATSVPPDSGGGVSLPLAAAVLVVGLLAVGAYRWYRETQQTDDETAPSSGSSAEAGEDGAGGVGSDHSGAVTGKPAGETDDAGADETAQTGPTAGASGAVDPDPVVTDAARVEELLEEGGGQLRQTEIVDAMDWSKSKTSRVLSNMADEDRIEKLRIGRENVIRYPDAGPLGDSDGGADTDEST